MKKTWWKEAFGYQIYIRSFYDSNDDGIGDLRGIIEKLPYLHDLGINLIWICPFYVSPMDDNGYDVSDFKAVSNEYGTMADVQELIKKAHDLGIKIIIDLVLNQTSDEHEWFIESRKSVDNPYREYYYWAKPRCIDGKRTEPTNWASFFGGSCWNFDEMSGEYYMKIFSNKMPDLNWESRKVQQAMVDIVMFWLEMGIDGFRVDAVAHLAKGPLIDSKMDTPNKYQPDWAMYSNLPRLHKYLKMLNKEAFSQKDIMTVGEVGGNARIADAIKYTAPGRNELKMVFNFDHNWCNNSWNAKNRDELVINVKHLKEMFNKWQTGLQGKTWNAIYWLNHDQPRVLTHYGDEKVYIKRSAKALAVALYFMWGTPFIYNGEEIGMTNPYFKSIEDFKDVSFITQYNMNIANGADPKAYIDHASLSTRDNARTIMQWSSAKYAGFSHHQPWNMVCDNYKVVNVEDELKDEDSILNFYKKIIAIRTKSVYNDTIVYGKYQQVYYDHPAIYGYLRKYHKRTILVLVNLTKHSALLDDFNYGIKKVILNNMDYDIVFDKQIKFAPYQALVLEIGE